MGFDEAFHGAAPQRHPQTGADAAVRRQHDAGEHDAHQGHDDAEEDEADLDQQAPAFGDEGEDEQRGHYQGRYQGVCAWASDLSGQTALGSVAETGVDHQPGQGRSHQRQETADRHHGGDGVVGAGHVETPPSCALRVGGPNKSTGVGRGEVDRWWGFQAPVGLRNGRRRYTSKIARRRSGGITTKTGVS